MIHDLVKLLRLCNKHNEYVVDYLDECKNVNSYYIDQRYPLGTPWKYSREETKKVIEQSKSIIKYILKESSL